MHTLKISGDLRDLLWAHLLPHDTLQEQAAFLFCKVKQDGDGLIFDTLDHIFLGPDHFAKQYQDYIELVDDARIGVIKRAHEIGASLVEVHSHPGPWPAAFSFSDRRGLQETVPHMRWRLNGRPYMALVVAPSGFDALVWPPGAEIPEPLAGLDADRMRFLPTNRSLGGWDDV